MNNQNPLSVYEVKIQNIFTLDNLPAILALVNSFRPAYGGFVKDSEYLTVVYAAGVDTMDELCKQLTAYVLTKQAPKVPEQNV